MLQIFVQLLLLLAKPCLCGKRYGGFNLISGLWDGPNHSNFMGSPTALHAMSSYSKAMGANSVSLTYTWYVNDNNSTGPIYIRSYTPTNDELFNQAKAAHDQNLTVMLRPLVMSTMSGHSHEVGANFTATDWEAYTSSYITFMVQQARLAEKMNAEIFCVGGESWKQDHLDLKMIQNCPKNPNNPNATQNMRKIVAAVREVYSGKVTYSALMNYDMESWDVFDFVGIDAYYELDTPSAEPEVDELVSAFAPYVTYVSKIAAKHNKPVVFTEVGYRACPGAHSNAGAFCYPGSPEAQRRLVLAMFEAWYKNPWFEGIFWWDVYTNPDKNLKINDFVPLNVTFPIFREYFRL